MPLCAGLRRVVLLSALMVCGIGMGCRRTEGGWRGTIEERGGVKIVTNEGDGVDAGKVREVLRTIWTAGGGPGLPGQPNLGEVLWAEIDPSGNVFVLDHSDQKVTKLTPAGRFQVQFGGQGQQPGGLSKARRLVFAGDRLFFANYGNARIEVLGPSGEVFPPLHLAEVPQPGELYFANQTFYVERRFVPDGYFLHAYDRNWKLERRMIAAERPPSPDNQLRSFNTVCVGPDGIWILYMLVNRIQKVGFDGKVILETSRSLDWKFPKDKEGRIIPEILIHRACAVDPAGNLYVIYSNPKNWKRGNDVFKFGPDGRLRQLAFTLPVFNSQFLRFDREGNLYYSDGTKLTKARIERSEGS